MPNLNSPATSRAITSLEWSARFQSINGATGEFKFGVNWERKIGRTADLASEEEEDSNVFSVVAGLRIFF
ncbi:MAG: copper resistance protein B [Alphaproteobacteria bacterium]|jgi:hypothetical protein